MSDRPQRSVDSRRRLTTSREGRGQMHLLLAESEPRAGMRVCSMPRCGEMSRGKSPAIARQREEREWQKRASGALRCVEWGCVAGGGWGRWVGVGGVWGGERHQNPWLAASPHAARSCSTRS